MHSADLSVLDLRTGSPPSSSGSGALGGPDVDPIWSGLGECQTPTLVELRRLAALGTMTAGVAHDLGNFLQIITSGLVLIDRNLRQDTGADLQPLFEGALAAVDRAAALRLRILQQARAENPEVSVFDLGAAATGMQTLFKLVAGPRVDVQVIGTPGVVRVACDPQALENAIINLVANARDAMPEGGRLTVEVARAENPTAARAEIRVSDTGFGMSPETLAKARTPFFTTKPEGRGTGLGLPLVCDFARRCGGAMTIESAPGDGTCVTLRLPVCPD